ncbi:MAG: transporter permease [Cohnella sp.]|nr:transporter permease [Cohnella sp.]
MSMLSIWTRGLLKRRVGRLIGAIIGVALTVSLLSSLGSFIADSDAKMTTKAVESIPVDWQILLNPGADLAAVKKAVADTTPYTDMYQVGYADVSGFVATTAGTTQTTGTGKVVGVPSDHRKFMQSEVRSLLGNTEGVLVAQQTAANLHVTVGDTVTVQRVGLPPVDVKIDGVVDLPQADSLFQAVGMPKGTAAQAPPDNVLLIPDQLFHQTFDPQAKNRPDTVKTQLHVKISHPLPSDPSSAYDLVLKMANHVEAGLAGSGVVGDNLGARLDGVRDDAIYSRTVFLFLGLPGAILAMLLTTSIAASGAGRRRQEQALLRTRGATLSQIVALQGAEAILIAIGGIVLGILFAFVTSQSIASIHMVWNGTTILWTVISSLAGLLLSVYSVVYPAWKDAKKSTVADAKTNVGRARKPLWRVMYLDLILLAISALFFWRAASTGYQLVLAPEGVPKTSIHYEQFIAPLGLWVGGALFFLRIWSLLLEQGGNRLSFLFRPLAGGLSHVVSASLSRQRSLIARGLILVALAFSFAVSTSVFNATYNGQARVDAELTNGSDITITGTTTASPDTKIPELKKIPGVKDIQSMQHRFAFVGNDLQDIYGIDAQHVGQVTTMSNSYFGNNNAKQMLSDLAKTTDGVLVSQETITDFQLKPGDLVNLRLQNVKDHQYHVVPFHLVGMVREFPTAPKDSFLIVNSAYIAQQTGSGAAEIVMVRASGNPVDLAKQVEKIASPLTGASVTEVGSVQKTISSSLTAVSLQGLSKLEIGYSILLAAGFTGLILALGLTERRRTFAILSALGGRKKHLGSFIWSEGLLMLVGGAVSGIILGFGIAQMFVKVLTGVFDPPPESLVIPFSYLIVLIITAVLSMIIAVMGIRSISQRQVVKSLRNPNLYF